VGSNAIPGAIITYAQRNPNETVGETTSKTGGNLKTWEKRAGHGSKKRKLASR